MSSFRFAVSLDNVAIYDNGLLLILLNLFGCFLFHNRKRYVSFLCPLFKASCSRAGGGDAASR